AGGPAEPPSTPSDLAPGTGPAEGPVSAAAPVAGPAVADTDGHPGPAVPAAPLATLATPAAVPAADSLLQDLLTTVEHRALLCVTGPTATTTEAIATAAQQQPLLTVWVRPHPGTDETALVHALYTELGLDRRRPQPRARNTALELITTELDRATRLLVVPDAHCLSTATLQLLYGLWTPGGPERFPLVLVGEPALDTVLGRPKLASLKSCVFIRHRLDPAATPPAGPSSALAPEARENATATPATATATATPATATATATPATATAQLGGHPQEFLT
ncbi:AAA family ATPase, partial [Kitasatospora kifunensis]